ncbi:YchJ family protein [Pseudaeromonas sp. ZJS20]|uniref:YchJ family protein n=1 Tax=Pseudaeromonas aegiceratis TaxID=3153928 RepID=UPI00390CD349
MSTCPCGDPRPFAACCGPFILGQQWPSRPVELMRSRFSAFVLGHWDYILATWHPDYRPAMTAEALGAEQDGHWVRLQVLSDQGGPEDEQGVVEFIAWYRQEGRLYPHHERSRFVRLDGHWVYTDGDLLPLVKAKPNAPCPCGSGIKFKKCCGR